MKKLLTLALLLLLVLSTTGTALAAEGNFVDVPTSHWSYNAIRQLVKAGLIEGYTDKNFVGDRVLTRYEMALIIAKAMPNSAKADAKSVELINKLAKEYNKELSDLGVRIAKLEAAVDKNTRGDAITWNTDLYWRYTNYGNNLAYKNSSGAVDQYWIFALEPLIKIDSNWTAGLSDFYASRLDDGGTRGFTYFGTFDIYGNFAGGNLTVGNFNDYVGQNGFVLYAHVSGLKYTFGNKVKAAFSLGKTCNYGDYTNFENMNGVQYGAFAFNYALTGDSSEAGKASLNDNSDNIAAVLPDGTRQITGSLIHTMSYDTIYQPKNFFDLGYVQGLPNGYTFNIEGVRSDHVPFGNTGYLVQLSRGSGQSGQAGYNTVSLRYSRVGANAIIGSNDTNVDYGYDTNTAKKATSMYNSSYFYSTNGIKGWDLIDDYYLEPDVDVKCEWARALPIIGNGYKADNFFQVQVCWSVR